MAMTGRELSIVLSRDPVTRNFFRGVYSMDTLFSDSIHHINRNEKNLLIFNSSKSGQAGSHWLGILFGYGSASFFINSFARDPSYYSESLLPKYLR